MRERASKNYGKKTAERQERFAREYCIDLNGKRAAIAAGYSPKTAEAMASRLIRNCKVSELIAKLKAEQCAQLSISANWVLGDLRKLAGYDATQIFDHDGRLLSLRRPRCRVCAAQGPPVPVCQFHLEQHRTLIQPFLNSQQH